MTEAEKKEIVALVMSEISGQAVDFDLQTVTPQRTDILPAVRPDGAGGYTGVTLNWGGITDELTTQATQAKNDAETAKNTANTILTQVQNKGTEITNFVATSKTEIEAQKDESVNAVKSVYQTDLNELKGDLGNIEKEFDYLNKINLRKVIQNKYYNVNIGTDTIDVTSTSSSWNCYGIYEVNDGDEYTLLAVPATPRITLYDTDGILRGIVRNSVGSQPTVAKCSVEGYTIGYIGVSVQSSISPDNVILLKTSDSDYLQNVNLYTENARNGYYKLPKYWKPYTNTDDKLNGLIIDVVGDSISAGANNDGVGYAQMIANRTGCTINSYAQTGSTWVRTEKPGGYRGWLLEKVQNIIDSGNNPTVVILSGGYNDSQSSILNSIGNVQELDATHTDVFSGGYNTNTVVGCIEEAIWRLHTYLPNTKILYVITYPMGAYFSSEYVPMIRKALEKWSVPYVDFCKVGNISPLFPNGNLIFTDGVHPNAIGYDIMSRYVEAKLREIV